MIKKSLLTSVPLLLTTLSAPLAAAGLQWQAHNASGLGVAYAGAAAVADDATTVFFNPAGMTRLAANELSVGVAGLRTRTRFTDQSGLSSGGDAGGWNSLAHGAATWRLSPQLALGLGLAQPVLLDTQYRADWLGRQQAIRSEVDGRQLTAALAYQVSDKLSLGFGVDQQRLDARLTQQGLAFKGDDTAWGWHAGAMVALSPAMRLGIAYRAAPDHVFSGRLDDGRSASARLRLPDSLSFSVWQQLSPQWEAMGDLTYTRWDDFRQLRVVDRNSGQAVAGGSQHDNAWRVAWGAAYRLDAQTKLKFGIAYDRAPVNSRTRSLRMPDSDRLWLSLGGQWQFGAASRLDVGYAYLYMKDAPVAQGVAVGKYENSAHLVGIQYSVGY